MHVRATMLCRRRPPGAFAGNELVTSKYNLLNFIPVNLYHQFKRVANMYFAALVCLQVSSLSLYRSLHSKQFVQTVLGSPTTLYNTQPCGTLCK